jgi:endonuclease YncB( thermonuclease family)
MSAKPAYTYTIQQVVKIIDGDTIDVTIDLGFHVYVKKRVRLYGINTPEVRTRDKAEKVKGYAAKDRLTELLAQQSETPPTLILKCHGLGKFGRVIGEIFNPGMTYCGFDSDSINMTLVLEGHAVKVDY